MAPVRGIEDIHHCDHKYCSGVLLHVRHQGSGHCEGTFGGRSGYGRVSTWICATHGKDFERYFNRAKDQHGVRFIRSRVHTVDPAPGLDDLEINYVTEDGFHERRTVRHGGAFGGFEFIRIGLRSCKAARRKAQRQRLPAKPSSFSPVSSSKPGNICLRGFPVAQRHPSVGDGGRAPRRLRRQVLLSSGPGLSG